MKGPADAEARRAAPPVIAYDPASLPPVDMAARAGRRGTMRATGSVTVPPREARTACVPAGGAFRISCPEGSQVGDLNLWAANDPEERFYSGKTRALHGTHVGQGDRLWSAFPYLRPMATILEDSLDWYGIDADGGAVHDVIGTRCDPYTHVRLGGAPYHQCCHSNLTRALVHELGLSPGEAEGRVHDVLNVFMCTGFTQHTGQYFMKASPARAGDFIEFFAEIDLLIALSACPGGDCGAEHSSDEAICRPLLIEVFEGEGAWASPETAPYDRSHGI
ncbi:DUF1989 domain-containing protein [Roseicyclus sp. F158]|uniref:DUF1989 domain-containing protein n=1 Tax=Tropicimonas omnivorans TaxID=3075590 RepID=A0ABU3DDH5_9RHOB|nr:DUF1989 domain-containing protein [Roseicyclus sp. F158]MDT0681751.1 DUF1989 domain-containing protein [Roseicyclus sp. F158]